MISVRNYHDEDAQALLILHRRAVHKTGAQDYPGDILDQWSPPVDADRIAAFQANPDKEVRLVADKDNRIAGFGALVPGNNELRACYVDPDFARTGVGRALVEAIEDHARQAGLEYLEFDSSLTAQPFYQSLGYQTFRTGTHILRNGAEMACVRMRKELYQS